MEKSSYLIFFFLVILLVLQTLFNFQFNRQFNEHVNRMNIIRAINSASDTATEFLLWESQETPYGNIFIEPEAVWFVYKYTFLEAIGLNSRRNMDAIEYYFPLGIIAVNDGYFMRMITLEETKMKAVDWDNNLGVYNKTGISAESNEEWVYTFSQKIPYARIPTEPTITSGRVPDLVDLIPGNPSFTFNPSVAGGEIEQGVNPVIPVSSDSFPVIIADTMNGKNLVAYFPRFLNENVPNYQQITGSQMGRYIRFQVDGKGAQSVRGSGHHKASIARELLTAMEYSMMWNSAPMSIFRSGGALTIPEEIVHSFASENVTFVGPMVVAILDQFNWVGNSAMSYWTISNTQIVESPRYYVYRRADNIMYYSLCDPNGDGGVLNPGPNISDIDNAPPIILTNEDRSIQIFSTQEAAAVFGAYPDLAVADICA